MDRLARADRIAIRFTIAVAALVAALLGISLYLASELYFRRMVDNRREAAELQSRLLEAALSHQMLEGHSAGALVSSVLREVGAQPEVRGVMILDRDGEVRQANDAALVGRRFSQQSPACVVCHDAPRGPLRSWARLELDGTPVLRSVRPIANRPECHGCHAPGNRLNGILVLDVSLAGLEARWAQDRLWMTAAVAALGMLILASVGLVLRRIILVRLTRLWTTVRSIASGNLGKRAEEGGGDTIAALATDFNDLATALAGLIGEVKERETQLSSVMNSVDDGVVVLDSGSRIVAANQAFCRRFGTHPEALRGRPCREALGDAVPTAVCCGDPCPTATCLASGERQRVTFQRPGDDGGPGRIEEVHSSPVFGEDGQVRQVVEVWRDITERVAEETKLAELNRLESLGALASGLAHEINTPLGTMLTCAEAIVGRMEEAGRPGEADENEVRDLAATIRDQVLRCRKITEQFRRFSRGIPLAAEPVDLLAVLPSTVALVAPTAREAGVAIEVEAADRLPLVTANPEAVQHVLLNLLINAIQSFDGKRGIVSVSCLAAPSQVRVRIRDHGRGISPEVHRHLFEPFHSGRSRGTGVGLFLSRGIMHRFGGDVRLAENEPGQDGTCFEVVFARAEGAS